MNQARALPLFVQLGPVGETGHSGRYRAHCAHIDQGASRAAGGGHRVEYGSRNPFTERHLHGERMHGVTRGDSVQDVA